MALTEQEKEELFTDFALRYALMNKEDKTVTVAKNNHLMKDLSRYYNEQVHNMSDGKHTGGVQEWMKDPMTGFIKYYGIYQAYIAMRRVIPLIVNARKNGKRDPYKESESPTRPLEEGDVEEINKIGKAMIDLMISYLKGELDK